MQTTFLLETEELNNDFLAAVKKLFKGQKIAITVQSYAGESDFLIENPIMKRIVDERLQRVENGQVVEVNLEDYLSV